MAIDYTVLMEEALSVIGSEEKPVHAKWTCEITTPEEIHLPLKIFSIDIRRDYDENFSDYILLEVMLSMGVLNHQILPFKDQLFVTLIRRPLGETIEESNDDIYQRRFRAIMINEKSDIVESKTSALNTQTAADLSNMLRVEFQLVEVALEQIRLVETGGIYRYSVPGDVVRYILTQLSSELDLAEEDAISGVDMVPYDNNTPFQHVIVPHGTRLQDVPAYIQDNWGGVYSTGINTYLQDGLWYVWPHYNVIRFDREPRNLRVINVPNNRFFGVERSYRLNGSQLLIVATGDIKHVDKSHHDQLNFGNGIRYAQGDRLWGGFGETENNVHRVERKLNSSELALIERPNYNYAPLSKDRISNNAFSQVSRIAKRQGFYLALVWEYSKPELIYPGMPTRLVMLKGDVVYEVDGVVVKTHHYTYDNKPGFETGRFITNTNIVVFANKIELVE